jgi:hypothetical protein
MKFKLLKIPKFNSNAGLVDAINEEDFATKLSLCKAVWDQKESRYLPLNQEPCFYNYILERVTTFPNLYIFWKDKFVH